MASDALKSNGQFVYAFEVSGVIRTNPGHAAAGVASHRRGFTGAQSLVSDLRDGRFVSSIFPVARQLGQTRNANAMVGQSWGLRPPIGATVEQKTMSLANNVSPLAMAMLATGLLLRGVFGTCRGTSTCTFSVYGYEFL